MNESERDLNDSTTHKLKKAVRLSKKLQEKIEFEREVSRELAKRNEQLKKDFANETNKYKTLVLAFEDLYLEYKEIIDVYGSCLTNGLPPQGSESYKRLNNSYENKLAFLNTIRSKAGIERNNASEDILTLMSSSSLLRKSSESIFKSNPPPSPQSMDGSSNRQGSMKRAVSQRITQTSTSHRVPTRRQSTMTIDSIDLSEFQSKNLTIDSTKDSPYNLKHSPPAAIQHRPDFSTKPSITIVDSNEYESEDDLLISSDSNILNNKSCKNNNSNNNSNNNNNGNNHQDEDEEEIIDITSIPLFEHFLVIGASVDTSIDVSNELIDKQTRLMRGRLRTTLDIFFGRSNGQPKSINSGTITPASLASRQNSVSRGMSQDSDLISETASVTSERTRETNPGWRGSIFSRRPSVRQLSSDAGETESVNLNSETRNSDQGNNENNNNNNNTSTTTSATTIIVPVTPPSSQTSTPAQTPTGWSARLARMMSSHAKSHEKTTEVTTNTNTSTTTSTTTAATTSTTTTIATTNPSTPTTPLKLEATEDHSVVNTPTNSVKSDNTPKIRRDSATNSTWTANILSKLGVSTAVENLEEDVESSSDTSEEDSDEKGSSDNVSNTNSQINDLNNNNNNNNNNNTPNNNSNNNINSNNSVRSSSPTPSQSGGSVIGSNINKTQDSLPPLAPTLNQPTPLIPLKETIKFADPEILYHFPEDADPPPSQICGFCLPNGAKLRHLVGEDEENKIVEILYGENHDTRSARCFIFILEDKTLNLAKLKPNDEIGLNTGRTYGICVIHPRWINVASEDKAGRLINTDGTIKPSLQFETHTCYCFITRFPLFDFFFKVIWSMISYERIVRMENITSLANDRSAYEYLPVRVYTSVLERLTTISPPRYNDLLNFQISPLVATIEYIRLKPQSDLPEHFVNAAEWALPPLFHWLDSHLIAWALGFLMCEVKFIVIGREPAMISCAVIGLLSLLKPLQWLNPVVPFIPTQFMEFMQSIPPIVGGILVDPNSTEDTTPLGILQYIGDFDTVSAVLDLTSRDIYILSKHSDSLRELMLPGGRGLINAIDHIKLTEDFYEEEFLVEAPTKTKYTCTSEQCKAVELIQQGISLHLKSIADNAKAFAGEVIRERMNEVERKNKEILKRIKNLRSSFSSNDDLLDQLHEIEDDSDTILNGELICDKDSLIPSSPTDNLVKASSSTEITNLVQSNDLTSTNSSQFDDKVSCGDIESVTSVKNYVFSSNSNFNSTGDYHKFLRRFVSTQMFSEYDKDLVDMLRDVETVRIVNKE